MKKLIITSTVGAMVLAAVVYAQAPGHGPDWRMGPGWMSDYSPYGHLDYGLGPEAISKDQAREIANQYTEKYLKVFTVERVRPYIGCATPCTESSLEVRKAKFAICM